MAFSNQHFRSPTFSESSEDYQAQILLPNTSSKLWAQSPLAMKSTQHYWQHWSNLAKWYPIMKTPSALLKGILCVISTLRAPYPAGSRQIIHHHFLKADYLIVTRAKIADLLLYGFDWSRTRRCSSIKPPLIWQMRPTRSNIRICYAQVTKPSTIKHQ